MKLATDEIILESSRLRVEIWPAFGAKIASIFDKSRQIEWLWKNPYLEQRPYAQGDSYVEKHDTGGWDEVMPNIPPDSMPGHDGSPMTLEDHGEVWSQPWVVSESSHAATEMYVEGRTWPYRLTRRMEIVPGEAMRLRFCYTLRNHTASVLPYIWAGHAIMDIAPGDRMEFPDDSHVYILAGLGAAPVQTDQAGRWDGLRIAEVPTKPTTQQDASALKAFLMANGAGWARYRRRDGGVMTLRYEPGMLDCLGVWMNYGFWSGCGSEPYFNVGFEPMLGTCDGWGMENPHAGLKCARIDGQSTRQWSFDLEFS